MGAGQVLGEVGSRVRVLRQGGEKSAPKAPPSCPTPTSAHLPLQPAPLPEWAVRWELRGAGGGPRWGVRGGGPLAHRTSTPGLSCPSSPVPPGPSSDGERNLGFGDREGGWEIHQMISERGHPSIPALPLPGLTFGHDPDPPHNIWAPLLLSPLTTP